MNINIRADTTALQQGLEAAAKAVQAYVQQKEKDAVSTDTTEPFARGDVVRLKTEGPKMTVERIAGDTLFLHNTVVHSKGTVSCVWFDSDNHLCRNTFQVESLQRA
jgi:uncharacterized protein YodC (DUF2158 family)